MFHLILTACLASNPQTCAPILLPTGDAVTQLACDAAARRISDEWLARRPDLRGSAVGCQPNVSIEASEVRQIAPGVWTHQGEIAQISADNAGRIANLSFIIGQNSIAVIDAGASRAEGQALYAAIRRVSDKPISHLILTHMHPDHVLGAAVFAEAGASVVASDRLPTALAARADNYLTNFSRIIGAEAMLGTEVVMPDQTVAEDMVIDLGGRQLVLQAVATAHTDNDLTIRDTATDTFFAGDLIFRELTPVLDGSISGWLNWLSQDRAEAAIIVPGHGPIAHDWGQATDAQAKLLGRISQSALEMIDTGMPMSDAVPRMGEKLRPYAKGWVEYGETISRNATAAFKELEWQ